MSCEYKEKVLLLLKNDLEDSELEAHIEQCPECMSLIEGYLERGKELVPSIPATDYNGPDRTLKAQVVKYNRGRQRIIVFTIIGLIMGWLSYNYTRDTFIVTKIIMAIPYKISEIIYTTFHSVPHIYLNVNMRSMEGLFPQSQLVTIMAERLTPVLIGGAIYGSLGYFTGDKRIFTLTKFLRFAIIWSSIILIWIGTVFAANSISLRKNAELKDIYGFFLNAKDHGEGIYKDYNKENFEILRNALGDVTLLQDKKITGYASTDNETQVGIYMGFGRYNLTVVNWEENYMIMDMGRVVSIPEAFSALVKDYYEGTGFLSEQESSFQFKPAIQEEVKSDNEDSD